MKKEVERIARYSLDDYFENVTNDNTQVRNGNILSIEFLRTYAIFLVIVGHSAAPVVIRFNDISAISWWASNVYFSFVHHSVNLFIMASGLLILKSFKNQTYSVFFRKRFMKVFIPCACWGIIYILWRIGYKGEDIKLLTALKYLYTGSVYYHFWFFYLIIGLYLAAPILATYLDRADRKNITYFLSLWFLILTIQFITKGLFGAKIGIHLFITTGFIGYFLMGRVFKNYKLKRRYRKFAYLLALASILITSFGTYMLTLKNEGVFSDLFLKQNGPFIIIMSVSIFMLITSYDYHSLYDKYPLLEKIVSFISSVSFGIYLVHVIVLELIINCASDLGIEFITYNSLWAVPFLAFCTLIASALVAKIMQGIPVIRKLVP